MEKQIFVIDHTGDNRHCGVCKAPAPDATARRNVWVCSNCVETCSVSEQESVEHVQETKRKLKKAKRTLKQYIIDRFLEGGPLSVTQLAQEAVKECLTKVTDEKQAKVTVCATISMLRSKGGYPIEKVSCGVYSWRQK